MHSLLDNQTIIARAQHFGFYFSSPPRSSLAAALHQRKMLLKSSFPPWEDRQANAGSAVFLPRRQQKILLNNIHLLQRFPINNRVQLHPAGERTRFGSFRRCRPKSILFLTVNCQQQAILLLSQLHQHLSHLLHQLHNKFPHDPRSFCQKLRLWN